MVEDDINKALSEVEELIANAMQVIQRATNARLVSITLASHDGAQTHAFSLGYTAEEYEKGINEGEVKAFVHEVLKKTADEVLERDHLFAGKDTKVGIVNEDGTAVPLNEKILH